MFAIPHNIAAFIYISRKNVFKNTSYLFQFLFLSGIIIGHIGKIIKRSLFSYGIIDHIQNEILRQIVFKSGCCHY